MAAYYPSLTSPKNIIHGPYFTGQKVASDLPENMIYHGQPSNMALHSQLLSGSSFSANNCVDVHSVESRDEMSLISQDGDPASAQPISRPLNITSTLSGGNTAMVDPQIFQHNFLSVRDEALQFQELSLTLGTEIPSSGHMSSYQNNYTIPGPSPWMSSGVGNAEGQGSETGGAKIGKYLSFDLVGAVRDPRFSVNPTEVNPASYWQDRSGFVGYFYNSKYLKAAQDLLDEVVNVREALKPSGKHQNFHSLGEDASEEADAKSKLSSTGIVSDLHESAAKASSELSASERQDLLNKMTKLSSILEEVDRRYMQYHQQMQLLVSSFEMVAGNGAAKPYTRLALQTISRQFRHLHDTIKRQIQVTQQRLGEQGDTENSQGGLPRLRYIDQQLRQQRALQQFGIVRQPWRPQKGLPETAVSILRAWLFEHFLNPYPKDSEKIMLAKQTGLTRNQVANWFINARVRLWKPMIEEMYKEEFGDTEADSQRSSEHAPPAPTEKSESSIKLQSIHKTSTYAVSGDDSLGQSNKLRSDDIPDADLNASTSGLKFKSGTQEVDQSGSQLLKSQLGQELNLTDDSIRPDGITATNRAAANSYNIALLSCAVGSQVSLALGLQQNEKEYQPLSSPTQLNENDTVATSADLSKVDYYCLEPLNQQDRFANPHLLSDFIA